ncbi:AAA family ATPase [Marinomonas sp. M1K-6]|uniref:AAA family ATPase n=1 Tax=Marinomonas profundi TaxID=2726122 RepID=A0A847R3E9_9GAMM|nr:AAA family ATPase [Marinomonas profundi]NLQ16903.1 AAA family ATPase [Marinomonas profundi]UDV02634.1 AAA family ATPase [Marinomonas profundi]
MLLKSIQLTNFLSYGDESTMVELKPLNIVIGANGSGKSNLIEAIELIRSAPKDLLTPIRDGGGIRDWLWKGITPPPIATINAVFEHPKGQSALRYLLSFTEVSQRFEIIDERIESEEPRSGHHKPYILYKYENGHGVLNVKGKNRTLKHEDIDISASILAQRKDPDQYPEVSYLGDVFSKIRLYREWSFGRYTPPRMPQKADMRNDYLEPDCRNLGLVLNQIGRDPMAKKRIINALQSLYEGVDDYYIQMEGGTVQVFLHEGPLSIPATRLSDGTLRYLCLLAILCHPNPPPLICIEEPELGLHPDVIPTVAELLKEASERTQLIVTTHSDILVDAMTDQPESVLVAEKNESGSHLTRLNAESLKPWLEKYRLGQLWTRGDIGGTRW